MRPRIWLQDSDLVLGLECKETRNFVMLCCFCEFQRVRDSTVFCQPERDSVAGAFAYIISSRNWTNVRTAQDSMLPHNVELCCISVQLAWMRILIFLVTCKNVAHFALQRSSRARVVQSSPWSFVQVCVDHNQCVRSIMR